MTVTAHVATLSFANERTAQRAETICRSAAIAAAAAREKKNNTPPASLPISPGGSVGESLPPSLLVPLPVSLLYTPLTRAAR